MTRKYVSIAETSVYTGLSASTIRNLIARQELTVYRPVPGRTMLSIEEIDRYMRRAKNKPSTRGRRRPN